MKRPFRRALAILLLAVSFSYLLYAWWFMSQDAARPILAITTDDSYPLIPAVVAKMYLRSVDYEVAHETIDGAPTLSFVLSGYGLGGFDKRETLLLADELLLAGADVDSRHWGYTNLQAAILSNLPEVVSFLLARGANPSLRTESITAKNCQNLGSLEFAMCLENLTEGSGFDQIIDILESEGKPQG